MSTPQENEEKNIKIVRRSIEALNTGDVSKVSEFIHLVILTVIPKVSLGEKNFVVQKRLLILSRS